MSQNDESKKSCRIIKGIGGLYICEELSTGALISCSAKGTFRKDNTVPLAGDLVEVKVETPEKGVIASILPRKNSLIRPSAANIDLLVILAAAASPDPNLFYIDKLTAAASFSNIDMLLVINKADLTSGEYISEIYKKAGINTIIISSLESEKYKEEISQIKSIVSRKVSFFTGVSGAGKTTLINLLYPFLSLPTGNLSKKIARGRHTTRCTELYKVDVDTYIADTPGFSMLDIEAVNITDTEKLILAFPDIKKYTVGCRYKDCTHLCEEGCEVVAAVERGDISESRHESYKLLYAEIKSRKIY